MDQTFTDPILKSETRSGVKMMSICTVFIVFGIWQATKGDWKGYLCAGLFGLCLPVAILQMLQQNFLRLSDEGFTYGSPIRSQTIPWRDVDRFFVVTLTQLGMPTEEMVGLNFSAACNRSKIARGIASAITDCEGMLPGTYGRTAQEIADMMNARLQEFRHRYGTVS